MLEDHTGAEEMATRVAERTRSGVSYERATAGRVGKERSSSIGAGRSWVSKKGAHGVCGCGCAAQRVGTVPLGRYSQLGTSRCNHGSMGATPVPSAKWITKCKSHNHKSG